MKSPVVKRSIVIAGHKTSVSLEDAFWTGLKEIAAKRDLTLSDMVAAIDQDRRARESFLGDSPVCAGSLSRAPGTASIPPRRRPIITGAGLTPAVLRAD